MYVQKGDYRPRHTVGIFFTTQWGHYRTSGSSLYNEDFSLQWRLHLKVGTHHHTAEASPHSEGFTTQ